MAGIIELVLERDGHDQPWGFRLQGGVDLAMPLSVQRVLVGTPADGTLHKGDIITRISCTETKGITHQQAADLFNNAGNQIRVQLRRSGAQNIPAAVVPAPAPAPLVNGSTVQGPTPVPVSGGVPLPGISSNTTSARTENPIVRSLPKTQFSLKTELLRQQKPQPTMESLSIQSQPYRTLPLLQPSAKVRADLGVGSISHLKMQDDHISGLKEPQYVPVQAMTAKAKHDELIMKQKVTGTLQHIQQTQQSLSSVAQQQQQFQAPGGGLVNKQYNSPLPLYSQENVQEALRMQAAGRSPAQQTVNPMRPVGEQQQTQQQQQQQQQHAINYSGGGSVLSPSKPVSGTGVSPVLSAALAESKPFTQPITNEKIPLYETNSIGGRRRIAQTASFNKLMMDVLGE